MKPASTIPELYTFRLYVAGDATNSTQALANLKSLCLAHVPKRHHIEVIDVFQEPERALADGIFLTPTLLKLAPAPLRRIVGTLSNTQIVVHAMGLDAFGSAAP